MLSTKDVAIRSEIIPISGVLDLRKNNFEPHATWIPVVSAKGSVGKTSLAVNLGADLALTPNRTGALNRVLVIDDNPGQIGFKSIVTPLKNHAWGLMEFAKESGKRDLLKEVIYPLKIARADGGVRRENALYLLPLFGGDTLPTGFDLAMVHKFLNGDTDGLKGDAGKAFALARKSFQEQLIKGLDPFFDMIIFDMPNQMSFQSIMMMRRFEKNHVVMIVNPNSWESIDGSKSYLQSILAEDEFGSPHPNVLILFSDDPQKNQVLKNRPNHMKKGLSDFGISQDVINQKVTIGRMIKDPHIEAFERDSNGEKPWVLSSAVNPLSKKYLKKITEYIHSGHYEEPEEAKSFLSKIFGN